MIIVIDTSHIMDQCHSIQSLTESVCIVYSNGTNNPTAHFQVTDPFLPVKLRAI